MAEMIEPELGQMLNGYYHGYEPPGYVNTGYNTIDALLSEHLYSVREVNHDYGVSASWDMYATANTGWIHELPEGAPFAMRAYCWCDGSRQGHGDGCPPNFHHFASDFRAYWYKHGTRGRSCNRDISSADWRKIQRECEDWILAQPRGYRVLITGSREWGSELYEPVPGKKWKRIRQDWYETPNSDVEAMKRALREVRERAGSAHLRIVEGGANGADQIAGLLSERADNASSEVHPALWDRKKDGSYNRAAGFQRNQRMVDSGADICVAFLKRSAANKGTKDCIERAKKAGIEVVEVWN
jgi:hypothetical protein